jgi:hypothetical protein
MAKKRKTSRTRKASRAKASARRKPVRRSKGDDTDPMQIVAALLVLILVGLGIYLYQLNNKPIGAATVHPPAVAVEKK